MKNPRPKARMKRLYLMVNLRTVGVEEDEEAVPDGQPQDGRYGGG